MIFRIKHNTDDTVSKHKVRFVANGFNQNPVYTFIKLTVLLLNHLIINIILSLVVSFNWKIRQIDINKAFLTDKLHKEVYIRQPYRCGNSLYPNHV